MISLWVLCDCSPSTLLFACGLPYVIYLPCMQWPALHLSHFLFCPPLINSIYFFFWISHFGLSLDGSSLNDSYLNKKRVGRLPYSFLGRRTLFFYFKISILTSSDIGLISFTLPFVKVSIAASVSPLVSYYLERPCCFESRLVNTLYFFMNIALNPKPNPLSIYYNRSSFVLQRTRLLTSLYQGSLFTH